MIYFDNAATTRPSPAAAEAACEAMTGCFGNPSSSHEAGRRAKKLLDGARKSVASALGAKPERVFFTSGGTEGDNWALFSAAMHNRRVGRHIITSAAEHDAVLKAAESLGGSGWEVEYLKPDISGRITAGSVEAALRPDTALVSLMLVNNEVGAVTDIASIAALLRRRGSAALLHTDAVQGFMKLPFSVKTLGADIVTVSAHKIRGVKGAGALWAREGLNLPARQLGGGQEGGERSGTEAMPAIAAFGAAAEEGFKNRAENIASMENTKNALLASLAEKVPEAVLIGAHDAPQIVCLSLPGYGGEVLMNFLDARGFCVSRGSACRKGRRSHVLTAMGVQDRLIDGALRVSIGPENTPEEARSFAAALAEARDSIFTAKR